MEKYCENCNKIFTKSTSDSKKYWAIKRFCSIKCSGTTFKKGHNIGNRIKKGDTREKSLSFKGGRSIAVNGYIRILVGHTGKYELEHRLVYSEYIGRKLLKNEHIHHINGDKTDNRIENLILMDIHEHNKLHTSQRWRDKEKPFRKNLTK